jgi:hypothetical protein
MPQGSAAWFRPSSRWMSGGWRLEEEEEEEEVVEEVEPAPA